MQSSHPLSSPSPAFNLSQHQGFFQRVSSLIRWPKYWSFSFSISTSNDYLGLLSFRIDLFDLLAVQNSQEFSNTTVQKHLWHSGFFMVHLSHLYITTGKQWAQYKARKQMLFHITLHCLCHYTISFHSFLGKFSLPFTFRRPSLWEAVLGSPRPTFILVVT